LACAAANKSAAHYFTMGHFLALRHAALLQKRPTGAVIGRGQKKLYIGVKHLLQK
jgi:hypothetical protein